MKKRFTLKPLRIKYVDLIGLMLCCFHPCLKDKFSNVYCK